MAAPLGVREVLAWLGLAGCGCTKMGFASGAGQGLGLERQTLESWGAAVVWDTLEHAPPPHPPAWVAVQVLQKTDCRDFQGGPLAGYYKSTFSPLLAPIHPLLASILLPPFPPSRFVPCSAPKVAFESTH